MLRDIQLHHNLEDHIKWKFTNSGEYTAGSAYKAQFLGCVKAPKAQMIWKAWAPPKCNYFCMDNDSKPSVDFELTVVLRMGAPPLLPPL
jgi:hypothetical protein